MEGLDLSYVRAKQTPHFNDAPGLPRAPKAPRIFNDDPERNLGAHLLPDELEALPDDKIIATAVALGMPRFAAEQARTHPGCRWNLVKIWCIAQDAAEGDGTAKEQIDYLRHSFQELRRAELIADRPDHTAGLWER